MAWDERITQIRSGKEAEGRLKTPSSAPRSTQATDGLKESRGGGCQRGADTTISRALGSWLPPPSSLGSAKQTHPQQTSHSSSSCLDSPFCSVCSICPGTTSQDPTHRDYLLCPPRGGALENLRVPPATGGAASVFGALSLALQLLVFHVALHTNNTARASSSCCITEVQQHNLPEQTFPY